MSADERDRLFEWLLVNGGPVVRYRTARELCGDLPPLELERMERELLAAPQVEQWLARLDLGSITGELDHLTPAAFARLGGLVHGSKPTALENVLGRLNELGLHAYTPALDRRMLPLMRIFHRAGNGRGASVQLGLGKPGKEYICLGAAARRLHARPGNAGLPMRAGRYQSRDCPRPGVRHLRRRQRA